MTLTRRGFHQLAAGALVTAAGAQARAAAKPGFQVILGVQSYSFRDRPLDQAIAAMSELGLATCELWQGHLEPRLNKPGATDVEKQAFRETLRKWRLETPLGSLQGHRRQVRRGQGGHLRLQLQLQGRLQRRGDRPRLRDGQGAGRPGHHRVGPAGRGPRVAAAARKHKMLVAMHNHSRHPPQRVRHPGGLREGHAKGPRPRRSSPSTWTSATSPRPTSTPWPS